MSSIILYILIDSIFQNFKHHILYLLSVGIDYRRIVLFYSSILKFTYTDSCQLVFVFLNVIKNMLKTTYKISELCAYIIVIYTAKYAYIIFAHCIEFL